MRRNLAALPTFAPTQQTWLTMEGWVDLDSDFERLADLGFVSLYQSF
jgi:hypothetical protein